MHQGQKITESSPNEINERRNEIQERNDLGRIIRVTVKPIQDRENKEDASVSGCWRYFLYYSSSCFLSPGKKSEVISFLGRKKGIKIVPVVQDLVPLRVNVP
ncbi:hypothetical protein AVEN_263851-1 [Araneus ventricosus]|uniref:Uncharacterized protein n=1 Tax=Araneus ventricosus TaxID=182803 RepID=A0A4Y2E0Z8_ARAVE|nr:hypothetical protein AVEN_263851-1 [Araneus ventricosus]